MRNRIAFVLTLVVLAVLVLPNTRSLYEGIVYYLIETVTYNPTPAQPVSRTGRFSSIYDLVKYKNQDRMDYVRQHLSSTGAVVTLVPIPGSPFSDVFAAFGSPGPLTVYCAHYDKYYDDVNYQGASDNTAAVSVLLAAAAQLAQTGRAGDRAFLFTGEEETGLKGASAFVDYVRANHIQIKQIVDLDSLGRDQLAIRPSAGQPGFFFTIPLVGDIATDGQTFERGRGYPLANERLSYALLQIQPDLVVMERFTALSDSNVFQANGIDTVAISSSNVYYLQLAWDTYADQVQMLDERNLDRAYDLIMAFD